MESDLGCDTGVLSDHHCQGELPGHSVNISLRISPLTPSPFKLKAIFFPLEGRWETSYGCEWHESPLLPSSFCLVFLAGDALTLSTSKEILGGFFFFCQVPWQSSMFGVRFTDIYCQVKERNYLRSQIAGSFFSQSHPLPLNPFYIFIGLFGVGLFALNRQSILQQNSCKHFLNTVILFK